MAKIKEKKTRVALTLPDSLNLPLTELSKLLNQPKTAIITEMLADTIPVMVEAIRSIQKMKEGQKEVVLETMADFIATVSSAKDQMELDIKNSKEK